MTKETFKVKSHRFAAALAASFAACLSIWGPASSSERAATAVQTRYGVSQRFSQEFGSKFTSGYFIKEAGKCLVTLMVDEKSDPKSKPGQTAAWLRLVLNPGQIAGLDSEEGQSLNLSCSTNARALTVDSGEKNALAAAQKRELSNDDFDEFVVP